MKLNSDELIRLLLVPAEKINKLDIFNYTRNDDLYGKRNNIFKHNSIYQEIINLILDDNIKRNPKQIVLLLKLLPGFFRFVSMNYIPDSVLEKLSAYITLEQFENEYIFKKNDPSDCFYGIIKGDVEIRSSHTIYHDSIADSTEYTKKFSLKEGDIFGDIGVITKNKRNASAYANNKVYLFKIEEEVYEAYLLKYIFQAEKIKKNLLKKAFPELERFPDSKTKYLLDIMTYKFYKMKDVIAKENELSSKILLILSGECSIYKSKSSNITKGKIKIIKRYKYF